MGFVCEKEGKIMIALKAHYDGKVIIPDEPVNLPKDEALVVHIEVAGDGKKGRSVLEWMDQLEVDDASLPADLAHQHDHYLYGTPKKEP
jgi:hypothetical protein